jgi:hypothetical protein
MIANGDECKAFAGITAPAYGWVSVYADVP